MQHFINIQIVTIYLFVIYFYKHCTQDTQGLKAK